MFAPLDILAQGIERLLEPFSDFVTVDAAGPTMIAEAPMAACTTGATPSAVSADGAGESSSRQGVRKAQITGEAFFDFDHGQDGVAPNAIELHRVLSFRCLSG